MNTEESTPVSSASPENNNTPAPVANEEIEDKNTNNEINLNIVGEENIVESANNNTPTPQPSDDTSDVAPENSDNISTPTSIPTPTPIQTPEHTPDPSQEGNEFISPDNSPAPTASDVINSPAPESAPVPSASSDSFENDSGIIILPDVDGNFPSDLLQNAKQQIEDQTVFTEQSKAVFSGFSLPEEKGEIRKIRIGFSFASEGKENEDDEILVDWLLGDENWNNVFTFKKDKTYSNKQNGGYFYADIFDAKDENKKNLTFEDLKKIKVEFTVLTNSSEWLPAYVDAVWLDIEYTKVHEKENEKDAKDNTEVKPLSNNKKDFKRNENPEFKFKHKKADKGLLSAIGEALGIIDSRKNIKTTAKIINPRGEEADILYDVSFDENDDIIVKVRELKKEFRPGLYKVKVKVEDSGEVEEFEGDFTWGVLTINVNKSIYINPKSQIPNPNDQSNPNDQNSNLEGNEVAYLQMGVLNDDGHTVCDARLVLSIKYQVSGDETILSTEDGTIQYSGKCSGDNVTDTPDYFTYYQIGDAGTYQMTLTRIDANTGEKMHEISDSFEVRDSVPFDVERIGPTRIYPPAKYEMILKIKANQDFNGQIVEKAPKEFEITSREITQIRTQNDTKEIVWQADLKKGESIELKYTFDAPDVSPYIYLLGPLGFYE